MFGLAKGVLFFRSLSKALATVSADLLSPSLPDSQRVLRKAQLGVLQEVDRFVKAGFWMGQERARERIQYYLLNDLSAAKTAEKFNTSENAIRVAVSKSNERIVSRLGAGLIDMIMDGKPAEALTAFKLATGDLRILDLVVSDVVTALPAPEFNSKLRVQECAKELSFLRYFTVSNVKKQAATLDQSKLSYIRYVLESSDPSYSFTRQAILNYLKGSIASPEDLFDLLP